MNYPPNNCRCEAIRRHFGEAAPRLCAVCRRDAAIVALVEQGYEDIAHGHRLAYEDCGVEVKSIGHLGDTRSWVPGWAKAIVTVMHVPGEEGAFCGPTLARAATDEAFRYAVEAILRLANVEEPVAIAEARTRLNAFAALQGLRPLPVVTR